VETRGLAADRFGKQFTSECCDRNALARVTLREVDVRREATEMWQAGQGDRQAAAPGIVDADAFKLREDALDVGTHDFCGVIDVAVAVCFAAAEQQSSVC